MGSIDGSQSIPLTTSGQVKASAGLVYGITVSSNTSGSIKLWDNPAATGTVLLDTYTYASGSSTIIFPAALNFYTACFATLTGTQSIKIHYN